MSRYVTTNILKKIGQQRKFESIIIPVIPLSDSDTFIKTTTIERLDKLADTFYGDAKLWWVIACSNSLGKGTLIVPTNTTIRIPSTDNVQEIINQTNRER
tara:strand:- start:2450 stop:2749 length:300 start_codon:yes stop_codon:yes gene_type:complete